jgi:hypothetical protein
MLLGCSKTIDPEEPQYYFGQKVQLREFYRKCTAVIADFKAPNEYLIIQLKCIFDTDDVEIQGDRMWIKYHQIAGSTDQTLIEGE